MPAPEAEIPGMKEWRNPKNGFYVARVHYTSDPKKRSPEWRAENKTGMALNDWNREYEIDFSSFTGKPVFLHDYDDVRMFIPFEVSAKFPIIRSWDFGYHHPAVAWCQFIDGVRFVVLESDMGDDIDFRIYAKHILHMSELYFPGRKFLDCCDRAGDFVSSTGDPEVKIMVNEFSIIPVYKYFEVEYTIGLMRKLMNSSYRNLPCFVLRESSSNLILRDALRGGYHYAERRENKAEKESPEQEGYYENAIDPVRYAVANFLGFQGSMATQIQALAGIDIIPEKELL